MLNHPWLPWQNPTSPAAPDGRSDPVSRGSLIAANFLPILLALIFGWELAGVVMMYWWENVIIGFWTLPRILLARGTLGQTLAAHMRANPETIREAGLSGSEVPAELQNTFRKRLGLACFFCFHYFIFCLVHGMFIKGLFTARAAASSGFSGLDPTDFRGWPGPLFVIPLLANLAGGFWNTLPPGGLLALLGLITSHGISFFRNYLERGEDESASPIVEMFRPYGRIVLLHVCIILGGFALVLFGAPWFLVILLMIAKTVVDLKVHTRMHGTWPLPATTVGQEPADGGSPQRP